MLTYTTAPEVYDGFGTTTIRIIGLFDGKPVRLVETPPEHVDWQRCRYASGMHLGASEEEWPRCIGSWFVPERATVTGGVCAVCCREWSDDDPKYIVPDGPCPSDDCPSNSDEQ